MKIEDIFQDKTIKAKGKVGMIVEWLVTKELPVEELLTYADKQKATDKATCIEAIEYATKKLPAIADESLLSYVTNTLKDEEPRIKWESAKVIGNIAKLFPTQLDKAITNLLPNAANAGTVEILKLKTDHNHKLLPKIEALCEKEEDNGVKKKYLEAIKKVKK
jgi:hypothetical protein